MSALPRIVVLGAAALVTWAGHAAGATFTAGQLGDSFDDLTYAVASSCSVREAIAAANGVDGADTILLADGVHELSQGSAEGGNVIGQGDLDLTTPVTIRPAGSGRVTVDANGIDRVFAVVDTSATIQGITITGGATSDLGGAGVAFVSGGVGDALRLDRVTIRGNRATGSASGGGLFAGDAGTVAVVASTISGNEADGFGGGVNVNTGVAVRISSSTITANVGNADGSGGQGVGGIAAVLGTNVTLANSVVAGNTHLDAVGLGADCSAPGPLASEGFNLVGPDPECPGTATDVQRANPLLGPLADNGGGTDTHLPLAGSPAVDGGDPAGCRESVFTTPPGPVITIDQRGIPRQGRCDIGAAEAQPDLVIEALTDAPDPVPAGGDITYTAVVRNQGAGPATASTLSLLVPDGVVRLGASGPAGACGPALDACPLGEIGPGLTRQATFTVRRAEAGSITVAALVAAGAGVFESSVANNTRQETTTLDLPPPPAPPPPAPAPPPEVEPPGADPPAQTEAPRPATPALGAVVPQRTGLRVTLRCPRTAQRARCTGVARLQTTTRRPVTLSSRRYAVARGRAQTLTLTLNAAGRRLIARGAIRARVVVTPDGRGARALVRAVRIAP